MNLTRSLSRFSKPYSLTGHEQTTRRALEKPYVYLRSALPTTCLAVILLLLTVKLTAQDASVSTSFLNRTDFKAGYFGNIHSNNGLNLGAEYLWKEKVKIKERRKGQKTIKHQLLLNGSLGYSTNFATKTQNGVFAYSGLVLRRVNNKSRELFVELNPLGLYRSALPKTYEVVGDDVTSVSLPGRSYYAPSIAIGIGRFRKATKRSGWYLNLQYTVLTNYNADSLHFLSVHFGRKFNFRKK
ncbi:MAG: hypothetical protein AB8H12_20500 [Lewinella sp.]